MASTIFNIVVFSSLPLILIGWLFIDNYKRQRLWDNMELPFPIVCWPPGGGVPYHTHIVKKEGDAAYVDGFGTISKEHFIYGSTPDGTEITYDQNYQY